MSMKHDGYGTRYTVLKYAARPARAAHVRAGAGDARLAARSHAAVGGRVGGEQADVRASERDARDGRAPRERRA